MDEVRIFISYAREDQARVKELYQRLVNAGFTPWLDREHIIPGMRWEPIIKKALKQSDFVLVCLSASSINKRGFLQREIKQALEQAEEKLEHDVYLIPARLDDCDVPDVLSDIQWVDLFEEDGWQWLLKAIEYGLKQSGKTMPTPVWSGARPDVDAERRRQEEAQQEEARQREIEEQRRAEAARLAEQKRQQEEQQRLQEQARQRELVAQRQRELEEQRRREQAAQRQREQQAQRQREQEAQRQRELAAQQRRQKAQEMKTQSLTVVPVRARRTIIGAAVTVALITLAGWLAWSGRDGAEGSPDNTPATTTPATAVTATPPSTPVPAPALVEVLRYEQQFDGARFKLRFNARQQGYLYLIAPDEEDPQKALTVFLPGRSLRPGVDFDFPEGDNWIEAGSGTVAIRLVFSDTALKQFSVAGRKPSEDMLQELKRQSDAQRAPQTQADGRGRMISAQRAPGVPLLAEIVIGNR